jgi:ABC-type transport system involved in multi-copper enzyme maturation permease subunit
MFGHAVLPNGVNGTREAVVVVSDAWGVPKADFEVALVDSADLPRGTEIQAATSRTDVNGFARFLNLSGESYFAGRVVGNRFQTLGSVDFRAAFGQNISLATLQFDLAGHGTPEYLDIVAFDVRDGLPLTGAQIFRNGTVVATLDSRGFAQIKLPPGMSELTLRSGSQELGFVVHVPEPTPDLLSGGPDGVMLVIALFFVLLIAPIATIAIAHDSIAREKAQGSIDLILSRPATRTGVLVGKFAGTTSAVVIPLWGTLLAGAAAISVLSGKSITWSFFGVVLLAAALYVACFVVLVLVFSTAAKTTGTAIMFGFLVWILFFLVWGLVVQVVLLASGFTQADRGYFELLTWAGLLNFNTLYQATIIEAYPGGGTNPFSFQGESIIPDWGAPVAFVIWFVVLLVLAVWVFNRKAAE